MEENKRPNTWHVWVTAGKDEFAEALVAKLVRRGFTVGPLGRQLITTHDGDVACVVAMTLFRNPRNEQEQKEYDAIGVYSEVVDVIKFVKGKFWSLVVSAAQNCTWNTGNVTKETEEREQQQAAKKVN